MPNNRAAPPREALEEDTASTHALVHATADERVAETATPVRDGELHDVDADSEGWRWCPSKGELFVHLVALFCSISIMLPTNAVFSAPSYLMRFYKYATHNEGTAPQYPNFWANCLTYYSLFNMVVCFVMEPLTLTQHFRRIAILPRLLAGLCALMLEVVLLTTVPARGTSEGGAVATICCAGLISGLGKSVFESTVYGMFGAFPPSFTSTLMGGVGVSGVLTSLVQVSVKGALGDGYGQVVKQSRVYYALDFGFQCATFALLLLLRCSGLADASFGNAGDAAVSTEGEVQDGDVAHPRAVTTESQPDVARHSANQREEGKASRNGQRPPPAEGPDHDVGDGQPGATPAPAAPSPPEHSDGGSLPKSTALIGVVVHADRPPQDGSTAATPADAAAAAPTTSHHMLLSANVLDTVWKIRWMFVACSWNFFVTLLLFPTITVSADDADYWFGTVAVLIFNVFDVLGRFTPSWRATWPRTYAQRSWIVLGSFARVGFIPLLLLYSFHRIHGRAFGWVMMVALGWTNGFLGSMALILGPMSRGVDDDGQRFVAGTAMGISILIGGTIGIVSSIVIQAVRRK